MNQTAQMGAGAWTETSGSRAVPAVFAPTSGFQTELREQVDAYFRSTGKRRRDLPMMYVKTAVLMAWWGASYWLLMFHQQSALEGVLLSVSLGLALAGIGFNVAHDACHGAYSRRGFVNQCMGHTLDLLGGSSYVWKRKHNHLHHTYTNVVGADDDIDFGFLGQLSPDQPLRGLQRYQHLYLWLLYGCLALSWQYHDVARLARGRIGSHPMERPRGWELVAVIIGKALFITVMFVIPAMTHSLGAVLLYFGIAYFTLGLTMAVVFQLAHCVEITAFPSLPEDNSRIDREWAVHQIETTANFARRNPLLTWYLGGLNYQVEHHLFPKISHLHYPALSGIVERSCARFGIRYLAHRSFLQAIASHYRFLRRSNSQQPA